MGFAPSFCILVLKLIEMKNFAFNCELGLAPKVIYGDFELWPRYFILNHIELLLMDALDEEIWVFHLLAIIKVGCPFTIN